jgi:hypothetical protein
LADVQYVSGKEQAFTENRCEQVSVLSGSHGAEQDDFCPVVYLPRERSRRGFEPGDCRGHRIFTLRVALQIL